MEDRWMTVQEVADYLHVSHDLIYRLAQKGKIPASKVGGRWRFKKEKIDRWMEEQSSAQQLREHK
jgi:excisionase family DNA binding protein